MKLHEILVEKPVTSSWIQDISYNRKNHILSLTLSDQKCYAVHNVSRSTFEKWHASFSKGQFWHKVIKSGYNITRIR